jgi:polygalacturonase
MSDENGPEGDQAAPGQEPANPAGDHRGGFPASSWGGLIAGPTPGRKPAPVRRDRDLPRQRRSLLLTFVACIATLVASILAGTQMSGASTASNNASGSGTGGAGLSTGAAGISTRGINISTPSPRASTPHPRVRARRSGSNQASGFSCSATGSSATTRLTVTGLNSNGTADDFSAIQNAIDLAGQRGGGIVALPAGTFMIDGHLALKNNVELTGVGPATVLKAGPGFLAAQGPGGGYPLITTAGAVNTTIADLTADQSGQSLDGNVPARLSGYVVEGLYSSNVVIDGVYVRNPFTYSIAMVRSSDFCVVNCDVAVTTANLYNQLDGIHILDSHSGQVIGNTIRSGDDGMAAHTIGAPVYDVLFADNKVFGGKTDAGLQLAIGGFPIYAIKVEDNDFYGSLYGIRVGYYGSSAAAVSNILISANYIHNLSQGQQFPAVDLGGGLGSGDSITDVTVIGNRICRAGVITVQPGRGNAVAKTTGC